MRALCPSLLAASLLGLLACEGGEKLGSNPGQTHGPGSGLPLVGAPIPLTRFRPDTTAFTAYSGLTATGNVVIRDATAWAALWKEIYATVEPQPDLPSIDFAQEMIVSAALGTRSSGGYDIVLAQAAEDAGVVQVEVVETSPGAGCLTTQALTQPVDLARMPRRDGTVSFVVVQKVRACGS